MGRVNSGVSDGAHRLLVTVRDTEGNIITHYTEGPYATVTAAKTRVRWIRDRHGWTERHQGMALSIEVQSVKKPKWETVSNG